MSKLIEFLLNDVRPWTRQVTVATRQHMGRCRPYLLLPYSALGNSYRSSTLIVVRHPPPFEFLDTTDTISVVAVVGFCVPTGLTGRPFVSIVMTNEHILMAKTLQIRIDEDLRTEADEVLHQIGLDVPSAVRLFLTKVVQTRSIPFDLKAPGVRVVELSVDPATQARMDEIGSLWSKKKLQRA